MEFQIKNVRNHVAAEVEVQMTTLRYTLLVSCSGKGATEEEAVANLKKALEKVIQEATWVEN